VPSAYLADPGSPASSLLGRSPLRGQLLAMVVEDRRVTGLVTTEELRLALLHARLRTSQPAGNGRRAVVGQAQLRYGLQIRAAEAPGRTKVPGNRNFGPSIGRHRVTRWSQVASGGGA
jgi:hypothetical protein